MTKFVLEFCIEDGRPSLSRTMFHPSGSSKAIECVRGGLSPRRDIQTFPWSSAVHALAVLMVRHVLSPYAEAPTPLIGGEIAGEDGSPAASLDYAIGKKNAWLMDMFGTDIEGVPVLRRLVRRINPERKRPGPVQIIVSPVQLSPQSIEIRINGQMVNERERLHALLRQLDGAWGDRQGKRLAVVEVAKDAVAPTEAPAVLAPRLPSRKEVLFFFTASIRKPYFAQLLEACQSAFRKTFGDSVDAVFRAVPEGGDYRCDVALAELLQETPRLISSTAALVVVPTWSAPFTDAVASLARNFHVPVVAFTLPFCNPAVFATRGVSQPPVVMSHNHQGGLLLGRAVGEAILARRSVRARSALRVLLIPGHRARPDSISRLDGFESGLKSVVPHLELTTLPDCEWSRELAQRGVGEFLSTAPAVPEVVFAANDQMMLGARDALLRVVTNPSTAHPLLCGYDGIDEVKHHITAGCPWIFGTVQQDSDAMAQALAHLLQPMITTRGSALPACELLVKPVVLSQVTQRAERLAEAARG